MSPLRLESCVLSLAALAAPVAAQSIHPLEPLGRDEMARASSLVRADTRFAPTMRFATLGLKEPGKRAVLGWPSAPVAREALALVHDLSTTRLVEVMVDLTASRIAAWTPLAGKQAWVMKRDFEGVDSLLKQDPRWRAALERRGITDLTQIAAFGFPADAYFPIPNDGGRYLAAFANWTAPRSSIIEGLLALIDVTRNRVLTVRDVGRHNLSHPEVGLDSIRKLPPRSEAPKPMEIRHPEGPSYRVAGHQVEWLDWKFRFGVESRSGLVLYQTSFRDGGRDRPVVHPRRHPHPPARGLADDAGAQDRLQAGAGRVLRGESDAWGRAGHRAQGTGRKTQDARLKSRPIRSPWPASRALIARIETAASVRRPARTRQWRRS